MLHYNFERVMKARGIEHPYTYLINMGIHTHLASGIRQNKVGLIKMKNLEKLCLLLHCTPNDLMEWIPDSKQSADKSQPLTSLRKRDKMIDITRSLSSLPLDKLEEIGKFIDDQVNNED